MNINFASYFKLPAFALVVALFLFSACGGNADKTDKQGKVQPSFLPVKNIKYTEVKRTFTSGVAFNEDGYQLEPEWRLSFPSDDSVNIYNPKRKMFVNAPVLFDHDSLFNIAWAWVRLRKLSKDSIVFQVMKVEDRALMRDKSIVYMTLYANDYIKNALHTDVEHLKRPSRRDTLFIQKKTELAKVDTNKAFAGRQIATLTSKTNLLSIERLDTSNDDEPREGMTTDYMLPEYSIIIKKAYDHFSYSFSLRVDEKGGLHFLRSVNFLFPEFLKQQNRAMKGIVDGYLKAYLKVTPATTLGIPHPCYIIIHVRGTK